VRPPLQSDKARLPDGFSLVLEAMAGEKVESADKVEGERAPEGGAWGPSTSGGSPDGQALGPGMAFRVALPTFEGPLDLLLHLIREHRIDIFDIPIALITKKYLEALQAMRELSLDVAGEFLLMAATLAHIKSRMLLPDPEPNADETEEQVDPREELVRRLLAYQKYKAAAEELSRQDLLGRDVFARRARLEAIPLAEGELGLVEVSVFKLIEALDRALKNAKLEIPHQVLVERVSISEAISTLVERLRREPRTSLFTLLEGVKDRQRLVLTFLALLEMCKLGLIRVIQEEERGDILLWARDPDALAPAEGFKDDYH
jgi:segregation and condensation protein A